MAPAHRLFFAVIPDAAARRAITTVANDLRDARTIRGSWADPLRYHLTLRFLGDFPAPAATIAQACTAGEQVRCAPIDFVLDRIATFGGRFRAPCVLRCSPASSVAAQALWRQQGEALHAAGFNAGIERRFTPHVTIGYGDQTLARPIAIEPIAWRATEFVLVDSAVGQARHEVLGRWPLTSEL
jgi:2'-5' RNA ligase